MNCPFCGTENRLDRETCYHCGKDLSMLRLIANKARHHYNIALEHAERHRYYEAITELQNALDLDSHLAEARVVLGTVYARLNRPEEARAQWESAMAISKPHERAHKYLSDLRVLRSHRPVLRRLWLILGAFSSALLLCALFIAWLTWPNLPARTLDRAWEHYRSGELAGAKSELGRLGRPLRETALELSAQSLEYSLQREAHEAFSAFERDRREGRPYLAIEAARGFLARHPPQTDAAAMRGAMQQLKADLLAKLHALLTNVSDMRQGVEEANNEVRAFLEAFPAAEERESLQQALAQAEQRYAMLRLESIRQGYGEARDFETSRFALEGLNYEIAGVKKDGAPGRSRAPHYAAIDREIATLLARINRDELDTRLQYARYALENDSLEEAGRELASARSLLDSSPELLSTMQESIDQLWESLHEQKAARLEKTMRLALAARQWEPAIEAWDRAGSETLTCMTPAQRKAIEQYAALARKARAVAAYQWMMRRAPFAIEGAPMRAREARELIERAQIILKELPMNLYPSALDDALFAIYTAECALGHDAQARQALERLRRERPKSRYISLMDRAA